MVSKTFAIFSFILVCFIILERVRYLPNNEVFKHYSRYGLYGTVRKHRQTKDRRLFVDYMRRFNKSYEPNEIFIRLRNFKKNLKEIRKLNVSFKHATFGLTKFSDWSKREFSKMLSPVVKNCQYRIENCTRPRLIGDGMFRKPARDRRIRIPVRGETVPPKLDWRKRGAVGPVLNQKRCSVCWAFSIAGVMESMAFIQGYGFTRLSIQQLIDCSFYKKSDSTGCIYGRPMEDVFQFLCDSDQHRSLTSEANYPLTFADEDCKWIPGERSLKRYVNRCDMYLDETKLVEVLSRGPVTALVAADLLQNYDSGVIAENCDVTEMMLNHAVQIVGYDTTTSPPYYIVRNSWGDDWGVGGYVKIAIGHNLCGIAFSVGYLEVY